MAKREKKSINEERNNEVEKNQFLKSFDVIFENFFKILDFNELDVSRYFSFKDSKKYNLFKMKRLLIVILFYVSIMCTSIIDIFLPLFIPYWSLSYIIILCVAIIPLVIIGVRNEMSFAKVINYNKSIYRKEKKEMKLYCRQLNLIINNRYLIEKLGERNYKNKYKNKIEEINNRLGYYSNLIRPLNHYFIRFGLISFVFSVSPIIFELISSSIQNTNISIDVIYFYLFLPLTSIFMSLIFYYLIISSTTGSLYDKKEILTKTKSSLLSKLKHTTEILQELEFGKN